MQSPLKKVKVKRKQLTNEQMEDAFKAVVSVGVFQSAATDHNVSRTTRISGRVQNKANSGHPTYLNKDKTIFCKPLVCYLGIFC